jgi:hypothetical protein
MNVLGRNGNVAAVSVDSEEDRRPNIVVHASLDGRHFIGVTLDENHAQALVLALQAAIAEVQARAVSL